MHSFLNHPAVHLYPRKGGEASALVEKSLRLPAADDESVDLLPAGPYTPLSNNGKTNNKGPVVYWMSRDQRVEDNRALAFALHLAVTEKRCLLILFCLSPRFLDATLRAYHFMLSGLKEVAGMLEERNIPFFLLVGDPPTEIPRFLKEVDASVCVTDFDPLRIKREWKDSVASSIQIPLYEVDAHNIVPCREASPKQEYSARTIRPKIHSLLETFLREPPWVQEEDWKRMGDLCRGSDFSPKGVVIPRAIANGPGGVNSMDPSGYRSNHPGSMKADGTISGSAAGVTSASLAWEALFTFLQVDGSVPPVTWLAPGTRAARHILETFVRDKLPGYEKNRNDPNKDSLSNLSPYLHFGHISAREVAVAVEQSSAPQEDKEAFLEELIVRKELSDNFCLYNPAYDSFEGFPRWAQQTLQKHEKDPREYIYTYEQLDRSQTHDPLWNAAQHQLVVRGKLHGYLRMYWAKKILEWTPSAKVAMEYAVRLNDRYNLDGRDPNGYVGCAWAIGGVHDRPWFERPIFGNVRYMSYSGMARKFDVEAFITAWHPDHQAG